MIRRSRSRRLVLLVVAFVVALAQLTLPPHVEKAFATSPYPSAVLSDHPSGYWRLGEASGPTAADSSGNGLNATYASSGVTYGVPGALSGDSDTAVSVSNTQVASRSATGLPGGPSARTVEFWMKGAWSAGSSLLSYGQGCGSNGAGGVFSLSVQGSNVVFGDGCNNPSIGGPHTLQDGNWHQVAATYDGTNTVVIFFDGQQAGSMTVAQENTDTSGASLQIAPSNFSGSIDEVAIYPSALSTAKINAHWQAGVGAAACPARPSSGYAGTVMGDSPSRYYRLGDASGRATVDSSGNCMDGAYSYGSSAVVGGLAGDSDGAATHPPGGGAVGDATAGGLPGGSSARTVEMWIKEPQTAQSGLLQYGQGCSNGTGGSFALWVSNSTEVVLGDGCTSHDISSAIRVQDSQWHHVAVAYDGATTITAFADGQQIGVLTTNQLNTNLSGGDLLVGGVNNMSSFTGSLDEVAIYPTALSAAKINAHWEAGVGAGACAGAGTAGYAGAVAGDSPTRFYRMGEGSGRAAIDSSGNCSDAAYAYGTSHAPGPLIKESDGGATYDPAYFSIANASAAGLPSGSGSRSVELWTKQDWSAGTNLVNYGSYSCSTTGRWFGLSVQDWNLNFQDGCTTHSWNGSGTIQDKNWQYIVVTYDGSTGTVSGYLNAVPIGSAYVGALQTDLLKTAWMGGHGERQTTESMSELAIYDHVLSIASMRNHFSFGGLIGGAVLASDTYGLGNCACKGGQPPRVVKPIDTVFGNMAHEFTDISISGRSQPLAVTRTYNSLAGGSDGPTGFGWSTNFGMSVSCAGQAATVIQENGSTANFTTTGSCSSGTWTPRAPRYVAALTHNGDGTWTFVRRNQDSIAFNSTGQLTGITDLNGYQTAITYVSGKPSTIIDTSGRTLGLTWSGSHLSAVTDNNVSPVRTVTYQYNDGNGNLTDVTDLGGNHWHFVYDSAHRMTSLQDPNCVTAGSACNGGNGIQTHYDASGRADWQKDNLGQLTQLDYSSITSATKVTDPKNNVTVDYFNLGLQVAQTKGYGTPQAATWRYAYDPASLAVTSTIDPNNGTTSVSVDSNGNPLDITDPLGHHRVRTYDSHNLVATDKDGNQVTTTYGRDGSGKLLSVSTPLAGTSQVQVTTYNYLDQDPKHKADVSQVVDPDNKTWQYSYDQYGYRSQVIDPMSNKATFTYDAVGRMLTKVSPNGYATGHPEQYTTQYSQYNAFGDVKQVADELGRTTTTTYDANRNLKQTQDANQNVTNTTYDLANEVVQVDKTDGTNVLTSTYTTYDADGNVSKQTDGLHRDTVYSYDALNHKVSVEDPLHRVTHYQYDALGNMKTVTDPQSPARTATYSYDAGNELTGIAYDDGQTPGVSNIQYDGDGQRTQMTDGTGTSAWTWDSLHRMKSSTTQQNGQNVTVSYGYDLRNHATSIAYPGGAGTVTRVYDDAGRMHTVADWQGNTTTFNYDSNSKMTSEVYPNGALANITPDAANQTTSITDTSGGNQFLNLSYTRDQVGNLKSETNPSNNYGYDAGNRLTTTATGNYGYDAADNPTQLASGTSQTYDAANQISQAQSSISLVGKNNGGSNGAQSSSTSVDFLVPGGVQPGDLILVAATQAQSNSPTTPAGYTLVQSASSPGSTPGQTILFEKVAASGEANAVTLNFTGLVPANSVTTLVYRGADPYHPIDGPAATGGSNAASVTAGQVNPSIPGEKLVMVAGSYTNPTAGSWSAPTGMSNQTEKEQALTSAVAFDQNLNAAGLRTGLPATYSYSPGNEMAVMVALKPIVRGFGYDPRGDRTSFTVPGPTTPIITTLGYDQANRMTSYGSSASYTYNGDGLRMSKTVSGQSQQPFVWNQAEGLPSVLSDNASGAGPYYIYGPGGLPVEQAYNRPAIQLVDHATTYNAASSSSTVNLHITTQVNDQIIVASTQNYDYRPAPIAGYNQVAIFKSPGSLTGGTGQMAILQHTAAAGENSVTLNYSGLTANSVVVLVYRGVDAQNPIEPVPVQTVSATGATQLSLPSVTTSVKGETVVAFEGAYGHALSGNWTQPSGFTDEGQQAASMLATTGGSDVVQGSPGTTGSKSVSFGQSAELMGATLALRPPPTAYFYHQDQLGSTRAITDPTGAVVATYSYDAYGNTTTPPAAISNPLKYAGQYQDAESGLYYLRARYYDPATGQFMSRDPIASTTRQPYSYVANNPLNASDPLGLYEYHLSQDIGMYGPGADVAAMQLMKSDPNRVFPFHVSDVSGGIHQGAVLDLETEHLPFWHDAVYVSDAGATSFTFIGLAGHIEGEGSSIRFSTSIDSNCHLILHQDASGPDAPIVGGLVDDIRQRVARDLWQQQADRLRAAMNQAYPTI